MGPSTRSIVDHVSKGTVITTISGVTAPIPPVRSLHRHPARTARAAAVALALSAGALAITAPSAQAATSYDVVATVGIGMSTSDGLAVDAEHGAVYVVNAAHDLLTVVDTTTNTVATTIPVGDEPFRVAVDPGIDRAYVSNYTSGTVSVIDTDTRTVVDTIAGFDGPRDLAVDSSTHLLYVANYIGNQDLVVVDPTVPDAPLDRTEILESRPWAVAVDALTHRAYATTLFGGTLSTISGTTVLDRLYAFNGPTQLEVDPSTQQAYVAASGVISVVDISHDAAVVTGAVASGGQASDVVLDPATGLLYVSNLVQGTVSVVDRDSNTIVATVPVGNHPNAISLDPVSHRVYVLNGADSSVSVIAPFESQEITFTSVAPIDAVVGGNYAVTATGGASGQPVTFSTTSDACSVSDGEVTFLAAGDCVVSADQAGDDTHTAAPPATQTIAVALVPTATSASLSDSDVVFGEPVTATATVTGATDGSVQFDLAGEPFGDPVALVDGEATSEGLPGLTVGAHQVGATFTPDDAATYAGSGATPQTLTVSKAATTATVSVDASTLTAAVSPTSPGAGTPTGTVHFYVAGDEVGTAELSDGEAGLSHVVPSGTARAVSAVYDGDSSFTGSSASTSRQDPVITASVTSAKAPRNGWYSAPVTVTFACGTTSAALTTPCPAPVILGRNAAGQSVTRTIVAADGGAATATVSGIDIDKVRPQVRITGVRAGATYFASGPDARCVGTDRLSGVATCTITRSERGGRVVYLARATDRAGNASSRRLVAFTTKVAISGAPVQGGRYGVRLGRTYTVLVESTRRPTYVYAAPAPGKPAGSGPAFHRIGRDRWALGVTFTTAMRHHRLWNIGTRVGSRTTVTTVRVLR